MSEINKILMKHRRIAVEELESIISERAKELLRIISEIDEHLRVPSRGDYSNCAHPVDAVVTFLKERGSAAPREEIIEAVLAGGFRGGHSDESLKIRRSISVYLQGTGARLNVIREFNHLVGLSEWDNSRFIQDHNHSTRDGVSEGNGGG